MTQITQIDDTYKGLGSNCFSSKLDMSTDKNATENYLQGRITLQDSVYYKPR